MKTSPAAADLRRLPPEPWGKRLQRARETTLPAVTQQIAAAWIAAISMRPLADTTVGRLEALDEIPSDAKRRRNAYLLTILYEIDPADLGLTDDDGPGKTAVSVTRDARALHAKKEWRSLLSTTWSTHHRRKFPLQIAA